MSPGQITELYQWVRCHQTERPQTTTECHPILNFILIYFKRCVHCGCLEFSKNALVLLLCNFRTKLYALILLFHSNSNALLETVRHLILLLYIYVILR